MSGVRVPLAVDAQVRVPFGPVLVPLRALVLLIVTAPIALACLSFGNLSVGSRIGLAVAVMMLGFTLAAPMRDGIWIGTWCLYRLANRVLPTAVLEGEGRRARVRSSGGAMQVTHMRAEISWRSPLRPLRHLTGLAHRKQCRRRSCSVEPGRCSRHPDVGRPRRIPNERGTRALVRDRSAMAPCPRLPIPTRERCQQFR